LDEDRKLELMEYHLAMVHELSAGSEMELRSHTVFTLPIYTEVNSLVLDLLDRVRSEQR